MTNHPKRESRDPRKRDGFAGYHQFIDQTSPPERYGSFEVFFDDDDTPEWGGDPRNYNSDGTPVESGWYWWPCFPGCLPDGEPIGPFRSSRAAYIDAIKGG